MCYQSDSVVDVVLEDAASGPESQISRVRIIPDLSKRSHRFHYVFCPNKLKAELALSRTFG